MRATAGRPGGCAVWATIVRPPANGVSYAAANALLERLAGDPQLALGLQLADWSAPSRRIAVAARARRRARRRRRATGARAELYADAIRACAGER